MKTKILVVSSCATPALINGLQLLCPGLDVRGYYIRQANKEPDKFRADMAESDRLVFLPDVKGQLGPDAAADPRIVTVPTFHFCGYHPDTCYIENPAGQQLHSSYSPYQSAICFGAHQAGLSVEDTLALYRGDVYEAMDYHGEWDRQKALFLKSFRNHGMDLSDAFLSWVRGGCFMYTFNHPKAHCLLGLAAEVARRLGETPLPFSTPPQDALADGPVFPCYPEIAEACGTHGDYLFKCGGRNEVLTLPQFVRLSFEYYDKQPAGSMRMTKAFEAKHARFKNAVLGRLGA